VDAARAAGRLILVAEDDHTNQKVILQQLALLGHAAEVAENGIEALAMWRAGRYALLLSDVHMPEMDGYSLTQAIRAEEPPGVHLPIVALTANALRGEAARATAVGMDGYLTKPVPLQSLRDLVNRYIVLDAAQLAVATPVVAANVPIAYQPKTAEAAVSLEPKHPPGEVQLSVLASLVGEERVVIREFLSDFQGSAQRLAAEIREAHGAGNLAQVGALAHRLKSSSRAIGALHLGEVCAELERAGKLGQDGMVTDAVMRFEEELALVDAALSRHLAEV
jgi:CheY-like chemotaxis protein/HPt (histidine-containing phosphotransfer) domain-containing protein